MYHIYYIKGIKVGCTNNLKKRVEEVQGYGPDDYSILASTPCIRTAAKKEVFFQKQLGYKVDSVPYDKLKQNIMKIRVDKNSITFGKQGEVITKERLMDAKVIKASGDLDYDIEISEVVATWILKHLQSSQFGLGSYVYLKSIMKKFTVEIVEDEVAPSVYDSIRQWASDKGIYDKGDSKTQYVKLMEEAGELAQALLNDDKPEIQDAIGDMVVVLTNLAKMEGLRIEDCIGSAYDVIKDRTGKMENGTFKKDK